MSQLTLRAGRAIAAASLLGAFLTAVPLQEGRAQATQPMTAHAKHSVDRSEARIKELHAKLMITPAQEDLWGTVAQTMRDNATKFRATVTDRSTRLKTMTAVEDLNSYQLVADEQSDGLKRLIPAFNALYASMTPAQQKNADHVFGEHQRHAHI